MMARERTGGPSRAMDLGELMDGQKVGRSAIITLVIATLAMAADGFDIAVMGFVVPELVKQWHVAPAELTPALSAGIFGLLLGAPLFGFIGDRFGRRTAILLSLSIVGVFTLATTMASSLNQLVGLRFITGIGLGGLIPNIIALTAEAAPKRLRARFIIIANFGVPAGFALPGWTAATLVPQYGWPALLLVGGVLPLLVAGVAFLKLRESIQFLVQRGGREAEVQEAVRAIRPDLVGNTPVRVVASHHDGAVRAASPRQLFAGALAFLTPMIWIAIAANQFANFFTISWLPTLLQSSGLSTAQAGVLTSLYSTGGLLGGLLLIFIMDRIGAVALVMLFVIGAPLVATIGSVGPVPMLLGACIAGAGFCVTGNNFGTGALYGSIYPTAVRSMGSGWAGACGRLGSLAAQFAGGWLLAQHFSLEAMYRVPAASLLIGAAASVAFVLAWRRRFGTVRLNDANAPAIDASKTGAMASSVAAA